MRRDPGTSGRRARPSHTVSSWTSPRATRFGRRREDDADAVGDVLLGDQHTDGVEPTLDASFVRQEQRPTK